MSLLSHLVGAPGFRNGFAQVNGRRLHYVGVGSGELMIFIHGFPEFWGEWVGQLPEFGRDRLAVALDLCGYNLSSIPLDPADYQIGRLVGDVKGLIEHFGCEKVTLAAHDWGGGVAWALAGRFPELVEKLIIINSPHPGVFARELLLNPAQREASAYMNVLRGPDAEAFLTADNFAWLSASLWGPDSRWRPSESEKQPYFEAWSRPGALTGGVNYYRASPLYPPQGPEDETRLEGLLGLAKSVFQVRVPTLVIWGELDQALLPGNLVGLEEYVADLAVARIPDADHWVVHEKPDAVNRLIRDFLDG
ncbi:MAG: alpha/beta hydrolase [Pseudomonadota bacterium]